MNIDFKKVSELLAKGEKSVFYTKAKGEKKDIQIISIAFALRTNTSNLPFVILADFNSDILRKPILDTDVSQGEIYLVGSHRKLLISANGKREVKIYKRWILLNHQP